MKSILGFILIKLKNFADTCTAEKNKSLFFTKKSNVHPSFKLGKNNFFDISPEAEFIIEENVTINQSNYLTVKPNAKLIIGENTYITRATISCLGEIEIGKNCILGEGLKIFDHNHHHTTKPFSVSKTKFNIGKIKMGDNVWTGANVTILKDVTIGDNCILGSGVLVYKDVPSNTIVKAKQDLIFHTI